MDKTEILAEIKKLSRKDQLMIVEIILEGLHPVDPEIEKAWMKEAQHRLKQFEEGKIKTIPGEEVMEKARLLIEEIHQNPPVNSDYEKDDQDPTQ